MCVISSATVPGTENNNPFLVKQSQNEGQKVSEVWEGGKKALSNFPNEKAKGALKCGL